MLTIAIIIIIVDSNILRIHNNIYNNSIILHSGRIQVNLCIFKYTYLLMSCQFQLMQAAGQSPTYKCDREPRCSNVHLANILFCYYVTLIKI